MSSSATAGQSFTTLKHFAPSVSFKPSPKNPSKNEQVTFTDTSTAYGGATISTRSWSFPAGTEVLTPLDGQQVIVKFTTTGSKTVSLAVTDSDGLYNFKSLTISIGKGVPKIFKEIFPD